MNRLERAKAGDGRAFDELFAPVLDAAYGTAGVAIHRTADGGSHWTDVKTPGT